MLNRRARSLRAFTLVELMIVVGVTALLAALALPSFVRSRKRSQAVSIRADLRLIDMAMDQYALDNSKPEGSDIPVVAWQKYIKPGSRLYTTGQDIYGQIYGPQKVGVLPSVPSSSWDTLTDTVDASYWAPYIRGN